MTTDQDKAISPTCKSFHLQRNECTRSPLKKVFRKFTSSQKPSRNRCKRNIHPLQRYLDKIVRSHGYSTIREESLKSSCYYVKATSYQKASFGDRVMEVVETGDCEKLRRLINAGISTNPFDVKNGEYLIHKVCRRGHYKVVQVMIELGGLDILKSVDAFGRTPLHVVCANFESIGKSQEWSEVVTIMIECDPKMLYMTDSNSAEPLTYVPKLFHQDWIQLLDSIKDMVWSVCDSPTKSSTELSRVIHGFEHICNIDSPYPPLVSPETWAKSHALQPKRRKKHVSIEVASMLSSGKMDEEEVQLLKHSVIGICQRRASFVSDSSKPELSSMTSGSGSFNKTDRSSLYSEHSDDNELDEFTVDEILSDDDFSFVSDDSLHIEEVLKGIDFKFSS